MRLFKSLFLSLPDAPDSILVSLLSGPALKTELGENPLSGSVHLVKVIVNTINDLSGVNFTNILGATFAPKSFHQKITNPNCKHIKAVQKTYV